jgi:hypothetical protein
MKSLELAVGRAEAEAASLRAANTLKR